MLEHKYNDMSNKEGMGVGEGKMKKSRKGENLKSQIPNSKPEILLTKYIGKQIQNFNNQNSKHSGANFTKGKIRRRKKVGNDAGLRRHSATLRSSQRRTK